VGAEHAPRVPQRDMRPTSSVYGQGCLPEVTPRHGGLCMAAPHDRITTSPVFPSLYERLGGIYGITAVVEVLLDRMAVNPVLNANPAIATAQQRVPRAARQYLVTELIAWATGGPQQYTGRAMHDVHAHLRINEAEWQAFVAEVQASLTACAVPVAEQEEFSVLVRSFKAEIVQRHAAVA
jgi:hemoglobin